MNRLTIVTLGTGGEAFLTRGVERALHEAPRVVLRTARHPMADFLKEEASPLRRWMRSTTNARTSIPSTARRLSRCSAF